LAARSANTARRLSLFPELCPVTQAVEAMALAGAEERGAIFTRREIVDFILDLVGYLPGKPLHHLRLLEPSFGGGDFLLPALERLLEAWKASDQTASDYSALTKAVRAVEVHRDSFSATRTDVHRLLQSSGFSRKQAAQLCDVWLIQGDFLLAEIDGLFDFVIGNPPYVRQEMIPDVLMAEYRSLYSTIYDRADIYVPFIERSLNALSKGGELGFICADRWMKNRYGGPLRKMIADSFHLQVFVDMVDTPAFHSDVIAYPAIVVIGREKNGSTRIAHRPPIHKSKLAALAKSLRAPKLRKSADVKELPGIANGSEPWVLDDSDQLALVRRLEREFPALEEAGCKVGIGVATGADQAFIGPLEQLDVEDDRKLPLVMTRDIDKGTVAWRGLGVINPFADEGGLVDLSKYPRLKRYLEARKNEIAGRHVALKAPANWYRTIDRIYPELANKPKLLIPDIKGDAHIVYEEGKLYPHHNLYFITSSDWDLQALQAILLSGIARLFISTYSTKMRGGYLRFQAQYLRRIRVPLWADVPAKLRQQLKKAGKARNRAACDDAVAQLYRLSPAERAVLGGTVTTNAA
jgi:hypothetical protein